MNCPNCNHPGEPSDKYCPNCGQHHHSLNLPFNHFLLEVLENTLHFETKSLNTFRDMIIKPGLMTENYNSNKRARYVPPVRLYIFISFFFFLLLAMAIQNPKSDQSAIKFTINIQDDQKDTLRTSAADTLSPTRTRHEMKKKYHFLENLLFGQIINQDKTTHKFDQEKFAHNLLKRLSLFMFILMPLFAFLLYLLYDKKKYYYSQHLIFSIHLHSFMFLIFCLWIIANMILPKFPFGIIIFPGLFLYTVLSLKRVYKQKNKNTIFKTLGLGFIYSIVLLFFSFLALMLSFM